MLACQTGRRFVPFIRWSLVWPSQDLSPWPTTWEADMVTTKPSREIQNLTFFIPGPSFSKHLKSVTMDTCLSSQFSYRNTVLSFTWIGIYLWIKKKHKLYKIMKFESSNIVFHEIINVWIFLAQQITTKTDLRCFEKPGPVQRISTSNLGIHYHHCTINNIENSTMTFDINKNVLKLMTLRKTTWVLLMI